MIIFVASAVTLNYFIRFRYLDVYENLKEQPLVKGDINELHPDVNTGVPSFKFTPSNKRLQSERFPSTFPQLSGRFSTGSSSVWIRKSSKVPIHKSSLILIIHSSRNRLVFYEHVDLFLIITHAGFSRACASLTNAALNSRR